MWAANGITWKQTPLVSWFFSWLLLIISFTQLHRHPLFKTFFASGIATELLWYVYLGVSFPSKAVRIQLCWHCKTIVDLSCSVIAKNYSISSSDIIPRAACAIGLIKKKMNSVFELTLSVVLFIPPQNIIILCSTGIGIPRCFHNLRNRVQLFLIFQANGER